METKLVEVESGERRLGAGQVAQRAIEHGAGAPQIAARLVMKSDGELNHPLQMFLRGGGARQGPPDVFQNFVGVEEVGAVEQVKAALEGLAMDRIRQLGVLRRLAF